VHSSQKTLKEHGDKATDEEKQAIETAIVDVEEALKGDDADAINAKVEALTQASSALAQKIYADQSGEAGGEGPEATADSSSEDAVDAEFEEVKDNK
jgi:molecular chaperone DnaK